MSQVQHILQNKIKSLPNLPGVYIMKDKSTEIIYIGKASSLKKRVLSYFQKADTGIKTTVLVNNIHDIDYIVTDSEIEALILESNLIKKHRPKFNVRLKDDKRYPYIAVTTGEEYPRIIFTRRVSDKNRYFGPYTDAGAARKIIHVINRIFKLKTCSREIPLKKNERPCINFQMKKCSGVCRGNTGTGEYRKIVDRAIEFLEGNIGPVLEKLETEMHEYSKKMNYETAANIRDIIQDIRKFSESQRVFEFVAEDRDYIALSVEKNEAILIIFEFRNGALLGKKISIFENIRYSGPGEIIRSFIIQHYSNTAPPRKIITQAKFDDKKAIEKYISGLVSWSVRISLPATKDDRAIINMILKNIEIEKSERESYKRYMDTENGLEEIKKVLNMDRVPEVIECFDISNTSGKNATASMVRFTLGLPDKSSYRRFRIRGYDSPDDPGMIHEALGRRIQHLVNEDEELPDLVILDGGRTQLSRAREIIDTFNVDITTAALAKKFEEIYIDPSKKPLRLNQKSDALRILKSIRDEAHRFAITYHRKIRDREFRQSQLDDIPDLGEKKKQVLLEHLKSVNRISSSSISTLKKIPGIGESTARKIYNYFNKIQENGSK